MSVSYKKLWKLLIDMNLNKTALREKGVHPTTIAKMGRDEIVSLKVLDEICDILNCDFGDIVEHIKEDSESSNSKGNDDVL